MAKWSRKKKEFILRKSEQEQARLWRQHHAPDGKEKAACLTRNEAQVLAGPGMTVYRCEVCFFWHLGHTQPRRPNMRVRI